MVQIGGTVDGARCPTYLNHPSVASGIGAGHRSPSSLVSATTEAVGDSDRWDCRSNGSGTPPPESVAMGTDRERTSQRCCESHPLIYSQSSTSDNARLSKVRERVLKVNHLCPGDPARDLPGAALPSTAEPLTCGKGGRDGSEGVSTAPDSATNSANPAACRPPRPKGGRPAGQIRRRASAGAVLACELPRGPR